MSKMSKWVLSLMWAFAAFVCAVDIVTNYSTHVAQMFVVTAWFVILCAPVVAYINYRKRPQ